MITISSDAIGEMKKALADQDEGACIRIYVAGYG